MHKLLAILFFTLSAGGCVSHMTLQPGPDQDADFEDGVPYITSIESESIVVIAPTKRSWEMGQEIGFYVHAKNLGTDAFVADASNVTATAADKELRVWTYDDRMKKLKRDRMWAQVGAAMVAAGEGMQQQESTTWGSGRAQGYDRVDYYETTTHTGLSDAEKDRRIQERNNLIREGYAFGSKAAQEILSTTTVDPGEDVTGKLILSKPPKAGPVELEIKLGADTHHIRYDYLPVQ